jgi:hypothetical protein
VGILLSSYWTDAVDEGEQTLFILPTHRSYRTQLLATGGGSGVPSAVVQAATSKLNGNSKRRVHSVRGASATSPVPDPTLR